MVPSNDQLDTAFQEWLFGLVEIWDWPPQYTADHLDDNDREVQNRTMWYPKLALLLRRNDWSISELKKIASHCYPLFGRWDATPLNIMLNHELEARQAINDLIRIFPDNSTEIIQRINHFLDQALKLGYAKSGYPKAANFASVLLTSLYPRIFVDFRPESWNKFAKMLGYPKHSTRSSYGEKLVWAGDFAEKIVRTPTYEKYWSHQGEPFWVIAGLCWHGPDPVKPIYPDEGFSEGRLIERRHKIRERNSKIVNEAKQKAYDNDHLLRCEVCGFSFKETYGKRGEGFIEAHHKIPLAELTERTKTKIEDLALVCSNCHVMIHRRDPNLTLDELQELQQ